MEKLFLLTNMKACNNRCFGYYWFQIHWTKNKKNFCSWVYSWRRPWTNTVLSNPAMTFHVNIFFAKQWKNYILPVLLCYDWTHHKDYISSLTHCRYLNFALMFRRDFIMKVLMTFCISFTICFFPELNFSHEWSS